MVNLKVPELSSSNNRWDEIYVNDDGRLPVEGNNQLVLPDESSLSSSDYDTMLVIDNLDFYLSKFINYQASKRYTQYITSLPNALINQYDYYQGMDFGVPPSLIDIDAINLDSIDYAIGSFSTHHEPDYLLRYYKTASNELEVIQPNALNSVTVFYRYLTKEGDIYSGRVITKIDSGSGRTKIKINSNIYLYLIYYKDPENRCNIKILTPQGGDVIITRLGSYNIQTSLNHRGNVILTEKYQMTVCSEDLEPIIFD